MWSLFLWITAVRTYEKCVCVYYEAWVSKHTPQRWWSGFQLKGAASPSRWFGFHRNREDILHCTLPPSMYTLDQIDKICDVNSLNESHPLHLVCMSNPTSTSCPSFCYFTVSLRIIHHLTVSLVDLPSPIIVQQTESTSSPAHVPDFLFPGCLHQRCPQLHPGAAEK